MASCGMSPIVVKREIEGFILNRLQLAVLNESFRLIAEGYVTADDLDKTIKDGLALRWSFMGPIETIDLNAPKGVADYLERYGPTIRRVGDSQSGGCSLARYHRRHARRRAARRRAAGKTRRCHGLARPADDGACRTQARPGKENAALRRRFDWMVRPPSVRAAASWRRS